MRKDMDLQDFFQEAIDLGLSPEEAMDHAQSEYAYQSDLMTDRYLES